MAFDASYLFYAVGGLLVIIGILVAGAGESTRSAVLAMALFLAGYVFAYWGQLLFLAGASQAMPQ